MDLKAPIIKALEELQTSHEKDSQTWQSLEDLKSQVVAETNPQVIYNKYRILQEVLSKELGDEKSHPGV